MTLVSKETIRRIRKRCGISAAVLKYFAVISMFVDHSAVSVLSRLRRYTFVVSDPSLEHFMIRLYFYMRRFGRLAFPIFCFMIVEGYIKTRNVRKYALRLFIFAIISEFPFDYALHHGPEKQNVYWTLLIGLLVIWLVDYYFSGIFPAQLIIFITGMMFARFLHTDYSYHGVFLIQLFYNLRYYREYQSIGSAAYLQWYEGFPTPVSSLLTYLYNGKKGRQIKYFFYLFYPCHLLFLGLIGQKLLPVLFT